jgi:hypothetical protein
MRRAAFYADVSTAHSTIENQVLALQRVAERHGWKVEIEANANLGCQRPRSAPGPRPHDAGRRPPQIRRGDDLATS